MTEQAVAIVTTKNELVKRDLAGNVIAVFTWETDGNGEVFNRRVDGEPVDAFPDGGPA